MIIRIIVIVLLGAAAGGCATPGQYEWNQYDQRLYDYYKTPTSADAFVSGMEPHVQKLEASGKRPPPGMYAELGTFYLKRGDTKTASLYYGKEMVAWPESKGLMTALITNINKQSAEAKK